MCFNKVAINPFGIKSLKNSNDLIKFDEHLKLINNLN